MTTNTNKNIFSFTISGRVFNFAGLASLCASLLMVAGIPGPRIDDLVLKGFDRSSSSPAVIIGKANQEIDDVFSVGESVFDVAKLVLVDTRSVTLRKLDGQGEVTLYLGNSNSHADGQSPSVRHSSGSISSDVASTERIAASIAPAVYKNSASVEIAPPVTKYLAPAVETTQFEKIGPDVVKIKYPPNTFGEGYPSAIYYNRVGDSLYSDNEKLGVGNNAKTFQGTGDLEQISGIEVGDNNRNSLLGGYGFDKGSIITAVNGVPLTSPDDVGKILANSHGEQIEFSYLNKERSVLFNGIMLIKHRS